MRMCTVIVIGGEHQSVAESYGMSNQSELRSTQADVEVK